MIVTAIEHQAKAKDRVNLFLDGELALGLGESVVVEAGIRLGQSLTATELQRLKHAEVFRQALTWALRYLGYRPRSEAEIDLGLRRHGHDDEVIGRVLGRLRELRLVDDVGFARFWKENRESFAPRDSRLLAQELRHKGIDPEVIAEATGGIDNETQAYRAAHKKARSLATEDYPEFRKRLTRFLQHRGFSYEVIGHVVQQVWQEKLCEDGNE